MKTVPLSNRATEHQFANSNNQEIPDNSQPILNIEERGSNKEFFSGAMRTEKTGKTQVDRDQRTMFEDRADTRVRISEQGDPNNRVLFTIIAKLVHP